MSNNPNTTCHELELTVHIKAACAADCQLRLFGLIDGTIDNAALEHFFLLAPEAEYEPLFLGTEYTACLPHSPYLLAIDDGAAPFLQEWGIWTENRVIWFLSSLSLDQQAQHWRSLIKAVMPDHEIAVFRFWNASILHAYLGSCDAPTRDLLIAPCRTVFTPQEKRHWAIWNNTSANPVTLHETTPWWHIKTAHLQGFESAFEQTLAAEIEDSLWRKESSALSNIYPPLIPGLILQGTKQARTLGLTSDGALTTFVRCQVRFGFNYWQADELASLWLPRTGNEQDFLDWAQRQLA